MYIGFERGGIFIRIVKTEVLKKTRLQKNLTGEDMAKLLGYKSKQSYYNIEKGLVNPSAKIMNEISEIFNKPVQYFFNLKVQ